jgi:hypothetical protein
MQSNPDSDLETNFELNDTLYARASISPADAEEVYLWLGANVMLAYPLGEAETMLAEKLSAAESSLGHCEEDLEFLREQITVCGCVRRFVSFADFYDRRSRLPRRAFTTGTLCNGAKTRLRARMTRRNDRVKIYPEELLHSSNENDFLLPIFKDR